MGRPKANGAAEPRQRNAKTIKNAEKLKTDSESEKKRTGHGRDRRRVKGPSKPQKRGKAQDSSSESDSETSEEEQAKEIVLGKQIAAPNTEVLSAKAFMAMRQCKPDYEQPEKISAEAETKGVDVLILKVGNARLDTYKDGWNIRIMISPKWTSFSLLIMFSGLMFRLDADIRNPKGNVAKGDYTFDLASDIRIWCEANPTTGRAESMIWKPVALSFLGLQGNCRPGTPCRIKIRTPPTKD